MQDSVRIRELNSSVEVVSLNSSPIIPSPDNVFNSFHRPPDVARVPTPDNVSSSSLPPLDVTASPSDNACCSYHRPQNNGSFIQRLRSNLCFCFIDCSPSEEFKLDHDARTTTACCSGWSTSSYLCNPIINRPKTSGSSSSGFSATTGTDQNRTLPSVHRGGCRTLECHATIVENGKSRWEGMMSSTMPKVRSVLGEIIRPPVKTSRSDASQINASLTRQKTRRTTTTMTVEPEDSFSSLSSKTSRDESRTSFEKNGSSSGDKERQKWMSSDESSRPSSGEIPTYDDEVCESYETTCSEVRHRGHTLPPFYDQVKEEPCPGWSFSKELSKLTTQGWYWGPISRGEAEEKLAGQSDGTFLVRDSSDDHYLLSLSFRSYGRTLHTRIEHFNGAFSLYTHAESEGYASIVDLIEHSIADSQAGLFCYSRARTVDSPSFPVRLTRCVSRFTQVRSLQYLCRFLIRQHTRVDHIQSLPLPVTIRGFLEERQY